MLCAFCIWLLLVTLISRALGSARFPIGLSQKNGKMPFEVFQTALVDVSTRVFPSLEPADAYAAVLESWVIPFGRHCVEQLFGNAGGGECPVSAGVEQVIDTHRECRGT